MLVYPNTITNIIFDLELPVSEENSGDGFVETLSNINKRVLIEIQNSNGKTVSNCNVLHTHTCVHACVYAHTCVNVHTYCTFTYIMYTCTYIMCTCNLCVHIMTVCMAIV